MKTLEEIHKDKLGIEPIIIGINWRDPQAVIDGILKAIETEIPYDETKELDKEEFEAYENGELVF